MLETFKINFCELREVFNFYFILINNVYLPVQFLSSSHKWEIKVVKNVQLSSKVF